jgi:DNA-binding response OmpR family regulator
MVGIKGEKMKRKKMILLVDDDAYFRFAMATELRALGYLVVCAENGERAIRMIEENREPAMMIDLVITDLVMPRKDGMKFCRELREINKDLPVLVITGFMSADIEQELRNMGCSDYLEKPFSPMELIKKVEMLLDGGVDV